MFERLKHHHRMDKLRNKLVFPPSPAVWLQDSHPTWIRCVTRIELDRVPDGPCVFLYFRIDSFTPYLALAAGRQGKRNAPNAIGNSTLQTWRKQLGDLLDMSRPDAITIVLIAPLPDATPEELTELCKWIGGDSFGFFGMYAKMWSHKA